MVNIASWESFMQQAEQLQNESPSTTRFSLKYRHKDKIVVLKVTDNRKCFKFSTAMYRDVKKIERMTEFFIKATCC